MAYISNSNSNSLVVGTAGDDDIYNRGDSVSINGAGGNDTIDNWSNLVTIDAGTGNDEIQINGEYVTIDAGAGNDTLYNSGNSVTIDGNEGNDEIINFGANITISGDTISANHGVNVIIGGGNGEDSIYNAGGANVTIDGGAGNDLINSYGSDAFNVSINGGDGNDTIENESSNVTVNGGAGDDSIYNYTSYGMADDGTYSDTVYSDNVTIIGGAGNDWLETISDGTHTYIYNEGDGHDTILSYTPTDTEGVITTWNYSNNFSLLINSVNPWSSIVSGSDIIITVGDGSITLVDAASSSGVNINGVTYAIDPTASVAPVVDTSTVPAVDTSTIPAVDTSTIPAYTPTVVPVNPAAPTDVVFIIDNTGSMGDYIANVKTAIISFASSLANSGAGYRLGLVTFGDLGDSIINVYGFTDRDTFIQWIENISLTGGGDWPESGLEAVTAATTMNFMPGSNKRFIVVSDADFHNLGESGDGDPSTYFLPEAVQSLLAANLVKMDVVGTVNDNCQVEWEPLANSTGGKFYDINNLAGGSVLEEIADDILGRSHVNINLNVETVPEGTTGGVFVVTPTLNAFGAIVPASSDAIFKAAPEEGDIVVGSVIGAKAYMAVPETPWRQIVTIPENWTVSGTWQDDALNITGNNVVVSGSLGRDNISINENATNITLVDISELQNGADTLSFSKKITPGTLQQIFTGTGVALYTTNAAGALDFVLNLPGIVALDESLLNCEVSNAGTPNTIRELIYGEVNLPIFGDQDLSGRIIFAQWGYGFTPPDDNPLITGIVPPIATSFDLVEDFGSPSLDEISPVNFAVTANDLVTQNFNALNAKVTEAILALNKSKF